MLHIFAYICFPSPKTPNAAPPHLHRCYILILQKLLLKKKKKRRKNLCLRVICTVSSHLRSAAAACTFWCFVIFSNFLFRLCFSHSCRKEFSPFLSAVHAVKIIFRGKPFSGFLTLLVAPKNAAVTRETDRTDSANRRDWLPL